MKRPAPRARKPRGGVTRIEGVLHDAKISIGHFAAAASSGND